MLGRPGDIADAWRSKACAWSDMDGFPCLPRKFIFPKGPHASCFLAGWGSTACLGGQGGPELIILWMKTLSWREGKVTQLKSNPKEAAV